MTGKYLAQLALRVYSLDVLHAGGLGGGGVGLNGVRIGMKL